VTLLLAAGDSVVQQLLVQVTGSVVATLGALLVALVIYKRTRTDEAQRLTDVLNNERKLRREERAFLAMQEVRAAVAVLGPALARRNELVSGTGNGPRIAELVQELRHVVHLERIHLAGDDRELLDRILSVTGVWEHAKWGEEWRAWTDDLNDFLETVSESLTARIEGNVGAVPQMPPWVPRERD
jgi:hypothetical protein